MREMRELMEANDQFYRVFEAADPSAMDALWAPTREVVCIHPGWEVNRGFINVANTWRRLFANGQHLQFALADLHAEVIGEVGIVHCVENIRSGRAVVGRVAATNVFRRIEGAWKMVLHHGSPLSGPPDEAVVRPGEALN